MVGPDTSLLGGLVAAGVLIGVNAAVARFSWKVPGAARVFEGEPTILIRHGRVLEPNLAAEGISREDLIRALREHGVDQISAVRSAILEVDGTISVLREDEMPATPKPYHRIRGVKRKG